MEVSTPCICASVSVYLCGEGWALFPQAWDLWLQSGRGRWPLLLGMNNGKQNYEENLELVSLSLCQAYSLVLSLLVSCSCAQTHTLCAHMPAIKWDRVIELLASRVLQINPNQSPGSHWPQAAAVVYFENTLETHRHTHTHSENLSPCPSPSPAFLINPNFWAKLKYSQPTQLAADGDNLLSPRFFSLIHWNIKRQRL